MRASRTRIALTCAALLASTVLLHTPAAAQTSAAPDDEAYRSATAEGVDEFARGHYEEALALFERAYRARPSARPMRGAAKCLFELRQYARTVDAADRALGAAVDPLEGALRDEVVALRARAVQFTGKVSLDVAPADAEVTLDGRKLTTAERRGLLVDAGGHVIEAQLGAAPPSRQTFAIEAGEERTVRLVATPPAADHHVAAPVATPPGSPRQTLGWIALGTGAAVLATGAFLDVVATPNALDAFEKKRAKDDPDAANDLARADRYQTLSLVGYVAGGVLAATGATLLLWPKGPRAAVTARGIVSLSGSF